jgi:hypothetical protein
MRDPEGVDYDAILQTPQAVIDRVDRDYADFAKQLDPELKQLHFINFDDNNFSVLCIRPDYFKWLSKKYNDDLDKVNALYEDNAQSWEELGMPRNFKGTWEAEPELPRNRDWREFIVQQPYYKLRLVTLDMLVFTNLRLLTDRSIRLMLQTGHPLSGCWIFDGRTWQNIRGEWPLEMEY